MRIIISCSFVKPRVLQEARWISFYYFVLVSPIEYPLYFDLHAGKYNSPYSDEVAEIELHLTLLYNEVEDWPEFNEALQSALRLYTNMTHFPGDFVEELIHLSAIAISSPIPANTLFQQLSSLLAKWQLLQIGDAGLCKRTQGFWRYWVSFALEHNDHGLLLDIFGASQGQRLLEIVQSNVNQRGNCQFLQETAHRFTS